MPTTPAPISSPAARVCTECGAPLRTRRSSTKTNLCRVCTAKHWVQVEWESENGIRTAAV